MSTSAGLAISLADFSAGAHLEAFAYLLALIAATFDPTAGIFLATALAAFTTFSLPETLALIDFAAEILAFAIEALAVAVVLATADFDFAIIESRAAVKDFGKTFINL